MEPRVLGRTGLQVAPLGLGTVKLGRNTDVKYPQPFTLPGDKEVTDLLESALATGIDLYDTAPAYGSSELRLGPFVRRHRNELVLCTKAGERYEDGTSRFDFSADAIVRSAEESLRRLRTEVLDILLLHSDGADLHILEQTDALEGLRQLKSAGKVRAVGISAKTSEGILAASETLDVVMAPFSEISPELGAALRAAHERGTAVLAIKTLASGRAARSSSARAVDQALEFVLRQPFVDGLVLGTLRIEHLRQAAAVARRVDASRR